MKRLLIILVASYCSLNLFSQDLVVTILGDSINCKITRVGANKIYFIYGSDNGVRSVFLPIYNIKTYKYNYFQKGDNPKNRDAGNTEFRPFQLSLEGGLGLTLGKLDEDIPDILTSYYKNLRSGFKLGVGMDYYLSETFGIGLKYRRFMTSNKIDNVTITNPYGQTRSGILSDNLKISFYAPSFSMRSLYGNGQSAFYISYYAGYINYKDDALIVDPYTITGGTIAFGMDAGYDLELSDHFLLGFQASLISGVLKKFKFDDGTSVQTITLDKGNYESLSRLDFSICLKLR
jgi:hypothetical protein